MPPKRSTRSVKKVKIETAATEAEIDAALKSGEQPGDTFEQLFHGYPAIAADASDDSDASDIDYTRKRKHPANNVVGKQAKPRSRKLTMAKNAAPDPPPVADELSDMEDDSDLEIGAGASWLKPRPVTSPKSERKQAQNPQHDKTPANTLQILVNSGAKNGGSTITVNLSDLLSENNAGKTLTLNPNNDDTLVHDEDATLLPDTPTTVPSLRMQRLTDALARKAASKKKKVGFTDLPHEIRVRIYRCVFVTPSPINFHSRRDFQRSSNILRACKLVHEEGREVLYGENAFHFERSHSTRGKFFEEDWREIGYKDIRRFFETIGSTNISMMRYISFEFSDATKAYSPTDEVERRFVNDPVLWRCLELIGANAHLHKFAFTFAGRRYLERTDLHFLRALSSIKSQEVVNVANFAGGYKARPELVKDLKKLMVVPRDDPETIDGKKKKRPTVVMHHERNYKNSYYDIHWR